MAIARHTIDASGADMVICPTPEHPDQVCWPHGDRITPDLVTFARRLAQNPRFYYE